MKICLSCKNTDVSNDWSCLACGWKPTTLNNFLAFSPELAETSNKFFDRTAFSQLYKMESTHFWFKARNKLIQWAVKKDFPDANKFLELGCGTGFVSEGIKKHCKHLNMSAADIFTESLVFTKQRIGNEAEIFQMDGRAFPFKNEFDLIGSFDVLEHIEEDTTVLQQMHSALNDNGGVILSVPQHPKLWSKTDEAACHVRRYKRHELEEKLRNSGFEIIMSTSFVTLLLPLMILSRKKNASKEFDPTDEFKMGKWLNCALEAILNFENFCIKLGIRLPIGGSRLVIARKI